MIMPTVDATASAPPELRSALRLPRNAAPPPATITPAAPGAVVAGGRGWQVIGWLEDAGLLLLLALAFPLAILVVGTPVALLVRLLLEIVRRW